MQPVNSRIQKISDPVKRGRGRPATGSGTVVTGRLRDDVLAMLDAWGAKHGYTRSQAVARLIERGLKAK